MQLEPTRYAGSANHLCFNDYKKDYEEKIKKNPKYKWGSDPNWR